MSEGYRHHPIRSGRAWLTDAYYVPVAIVVGQVCELLKAIHSSRRFGKHRTELNVETRGLSRKRVDTFRSVDVLRGQ